MGAICRCNYGQTVVAQLYLDLSDSYVPIFYRKELHHVKKGENIYKRKDGRWEGRYIKARSPQGKAVYGSVYASTYNEVRKKRSQAMADLVTDPSVPDIVPLQPQSFAKVSGDWLVSIQPKIKESSYMKYTNLLNSYLLPELSQILISELTSNKTRNAVTICSLTVEPPEKGCLPKPYPIFCPC